MGTNLAFIPCPTSPSELTQQVALPWAAQPCAHAGLVRLATSPGLAWSILHTLAAALPYCEIRCLLHPPSHAGTPVPREQALLLEALALQPVDNGYSNAMHRVPLSCIIMTETQR